MDQQAVKRRVRIAVSVFFVALTAVLMALWVRSYWWNEMVSRIGGNTFVAIGSNTGCLYIVQTQSISVPGVGVAPQWAFDRAVAMDLPADFYLKPTAHTNILRIPHWSFVLTCATLAAVPWASRRFSVRSLMLATTLVAVVLGLVCHTVR